MSLAINEWIDGKKTEKWKKKKTKKHVKKEWSFQLLDTVYINYLCRTTLDTIVQSVET